MKRIRVLLVTSDREECGIREYGRMLQEVFEGDEEVEIVEWPVPSWPNSGTSLPPELGKFDLCHVNHHAALHAAWSPGVIDALKSIGWGVVVTQHDTFEKLSIMKERGFHDFSESADVVVVHEPVEGLREMIGGGKVATSGKANVWYLRQPVWRPEGLIPWTDLPKKTIGTVGWPFPWKNYETLLQAAENCGWGVLLIAPGATEEQQLRWCEINPNVVVRGFLPRDEVVAALRGCTATAFLYTTGNSGTSAAIRLGIAAGRPLIAFRSCRQFRDLEFHCQISYAINFVHAQAAVEHWLKKYGENPGLVKEHGQYVEALADLDSWQVVGKEKYREVYRQAAEAAWRRKGGS